MANIFSASSLNHPPSTPKMKALLLGAYEKKDNDVKTLVLTSLAQKVNEQTGGKLLEQLNV